MTKTTRCRQGHLLEESGGTCPGDCPQVHYVTVEGSDYPAPFDAVAYVLGRGITGHFVYEEPAKQDGLIVCPVVEKKEVMI